MKAVYIAKKGRLQYGELPIQRPKIGEALVRVKACALNHLDLWLLKGRSGMEYPHIPGSDVAGVTEKLNGSSKLKVGDEVVINPAIPCGGCPRCKSKQPCEMVKILGSDTPGGFAEYITVPVHQLFKKPNHLSFVEAAAFPLTFLTAWRMLKTRANLQPNESVFIWGASGSLGVAAVQIAKYLKARVIAAARDRAVGQKLKRIGADEVVQYKNVEARKAVKKLTGGTGVDVVFETVGVKTWPQTLAILRPLGRVVICGTTSGETTTVDLSELYAYQHSIIGSRMGNKEEFEQVLKLISSKKLQPIIDKVFSLEDAAKALERMEKRQHVGKIVVEVT